MVDELSHGPFELPLDLQPFYESVSESAIATGGWSLIYKSLRPKLYAPSYPFVVKYGRLVDYKRDLSRYFRKEYNFLSGIDHPGFPKVSFIHTNGDMPWFLLENAGSDLISVSSSSDLSRERKMKLSISILEVLAYLHRLGILHADLKLGNVGLNGNEIKVFDFGLATTKPYYLESDTTPDYAPPEKGHVSLAYDVFQLGLLVSEFLKGDYPLDSQYIETIPVSSFNICRWTYDDKGNLIIENTGNSDGTNCSIKNYPYDGFRIDLGNSHLEEVVAKATRKDPGRRYQNAGEMLEDFLKVAA